MKKKGLHFTVAPTKLGWGCLLFNPEETGSVPKVVAVQSLLGKPKTSWNLRFTRFQYAHAAVGSLLGLLPVCALVVAGRRLMLGRWEPLSVVATLVTALVALLVLVGCRLVTARVSRQTCRVGLTTFRYESSVTLALWAIACSFPGSQIGAWLIWASAIALDFAAQRIIAERTPVRAVVRSQTPTGSSVATPMEIASMEEQTSVETSESHPLSEGETVLQNVLRVRDEAGQEYIYATLRGDFEPGDRAVTLYVGFCPPFQSLPQVEAEAIDGAPAIAKVIQALHNGAQIEVDLDEPSLASAHVMVEVAAFVP